MYALVDCNNFFVSAERVFRPDLRQQPVCVLSSNDGCVVALSNEAKALGIRRGNPLFKIRDIVERNHVTIFSSNFILYAGMSERVMQILADAVKEVDIYSIDEAFLHLDGYDFINIEEEMRLLAARILRWTGIPVSIGVAPTKTLAKIAAKYAKQYAGYRQVCMMETDEKRQRALAKFPIADVWGIGRQTVKKLEAIPVRTAADFVKMSSSYVRSQFAVTGLRTWQELRGIDCIDTNEISEKQSICMSRSFARRISDFAELKEPIASFASECARKLRKQGSAAHIVTVFIFTDRFKTEEPQCQKIQSMTLPIATSDSAEIIAAAHKLLQTMFQKGFAFKKAGVVVSGIVPANAIQQQLFDVVEDRPKRRALNNIVDAINDKFGANTVLNAAQTRSSEEWLPRKEFKSPNYLTDVRELLAVK